MEEISKQEIKVFYCYAREDEALRKELDVHLSGLKRQYHLITWSDHEILPGEDFEKIIDARLSTADLVLLLISPHFLNSDYCYSKEMRQALARHQEGTCVVVPILLHPTYWEETPFSHIQLLPSNARAITSWPDRYEAFHDVAKGISNTIKNIIQSRKTKEEWLQEGNIPRNIKHSNESNIEHAVTLKENIKKTPAVMIYFAGLLTAVFGLIGAIIAIDPILLVGSIAICAGLVALFIGIVVFFRTHYRLQYIGCVQYILWTIGIIFSMIIILILLSLYKDQYVTGVLFYMMFLIYGFMLIMLTYKNTFFVRRLSKIQK